LAGDTANFTIFNLLEEAVSNSLLKNLSYRVDARRKRGEISFAFIKHRKLAHADAE
jgi:hypothetical protein